LLDDQPLDVSSKFSSQAEPEALEAPQAIADQEGRQLQSVLGEAMREYV
jgi:hypothetical protein